MRKQKNEIRVNGKDKEQIRVTLNRDFGHNFTYTNPIGSKYAYFKFKDIKTKNKAYKDLMMWYSGKSLTKFRKTIKR